MGVVTYEMEVTTTIPPARIFNAILDDNLIPKIAPQVFKSVEIIEGDGGPGSIKHLTFGEGSPFKSMKHKIGVIDKENFAFSYSLIEGDGLMGKLEKIFFEGKFVATPEGGSICKSSSKYYTIGEFDLTEEHIKGSIENALGSFKIIEAYLVANPDAYN